MSAGGTDGPQPVDRNASASARGTMLSTTIYSSGVWARAPSGPVAQSVGAPTAEVKPESAQPPVYSPSIARPASFAAPA